MTSQKEMKWIKKMVLIILKEKKISKVHLVMDSRISISYYDKLKPFMEELYEHRVKYNKEDRVWEAIESEPEKGKEPESITC